MKIIIFAALLTVAAGFRFKVKDAKETCAMVEVDGNLDIEAFEEKKSVGKQSLPLSGATLIADSNCTLIKLNMTKSAQMWFQFNAKTDSWLVTPVSAFVPDKLFNSSSLPKDLVSGTADPFEPFKKVQSYLCHSTIQHTFDDAGTGNYSYTVTASLNGFQIQSSNIKDDKFSDDLVECNADTPSTTPAPAPAPAVEDYSCRSDNVTMLNITGAFSYGITYLAKDGKGSEVNMTVMIPVPSKHKVLDKYCEKNASVEFIEIGFYEGWSMKFEFEKSKSEYSVANISIVYVLDDHFPNAAQPGETVKEVLDGSKLSLKASDKGYYTCNSNSSFTTDDSTCTLYTKDFRFRAFDTKGDGFKGDVSQCSADQESNSIVPIAVGAALAGLVVIVLVAYLIGRKRSRKSGYESV